MRAPEKSRVVVTTAGTATPRAGASWVIGQQTPGCVAGRSRVKGNGHHQAAAESASGRDTGWARTTSGSRAAISTGRRSALAAHLRGVPARSYGVQVQPIGARLSSPSRSSTPAVARWPAPLSGLCSTPRRPCCKPARASCRTATAARRCCPGPELRALPCARPTSSSRTLGVQPSTLEICTGTAFALMDHTPSPGSDMSHERPSAPPPRTPRRSPPVRPCPPPRRRTRFPRSCPQCRLVHLRASEIENDWNC
jgi:hypothetical protein